MTWKPWYGAALAGVIAAAACAATLAPLAVYALTLAAFGLVHVLVELRYVDKRFAPRLPRRLTAGWLLVLGLIVLLRVLRVLADLDGTLAGTLELALVALLALAVLPVIRQAGPLRGGTVLLTAGLLLYGAWAAPLATLVVLAILHNLTPVGFLAERLRGAVRLRAMAACVVGFLVIPGLIASGVAADALAGLGLGASSWAPLRTGSLEQHLGVFVPPFWADGVHAVDLFAAVAYLQCLHYLVVIRILPRLEPAQVDAATLHVRWPAEVRWRPALLVVGGLSLGLFALAFHDARLLYGLAALVHAWVEVPVLLAALTPLPEAT